MLPSAIQATTKLHVLGLDVGGTKIAAGVVRFPEGRILLRRTIATRPGRGGAAVLEAVCGLTGALAEEARSEGFQVEAIGLGLCELVTPTGEVVSANAFDWRSLPVLDRLAVWAPACLEADVRAAARAEAIFGAGRGFESFLYVTIGTGISSCLVIQGQPWQGARGLTGTMASSPLPNPFPRAEGVLPPSLEQLASGPALAARYRELEPGSAICAEEILAAAASGEKNALFVVRSGAEALGATLALLVSTLDPEAVVMGGGLGLATGLYCDTILSTLRQRVWSDLHRNIPVLLAGTGADAGLLGAAASCPPARDHRANMGS